MLLNEHIPLSHRKALCGRLIFIEATESERLTLAHCGALHHLDRVKDNLFSMTREAISHSPDAVRLDEFLGELSSSLKSIPLPSWENNKARGHVANLMSRVGQRLATVCCQTCSPSHICNGSRNDILAVDRSGHCISQLRTMFDWASTATRGVYREYATDLTNTNLPDLSFSTLPYLDAPPGVPNDCFVGAATQYVSEGAKHISF
jgi:hypothetical protein